MAMKRSLPGANNTWVLAVRSMRSSMTGANDDPGPAGAFPQTRLPMGKR